MDPEDFLIQLRDEAAKNVMALTAVRAQAVDRLATVQLMAPSSMRSHMILRLEAFIDGIDDFLAPTRSLVSAAEQAAGSLGGTVPPPPPPGGGGGPGEIEWSTNDW